MFNQADKTWRERVNAVEIGRTLARALSRAAGAMALAGLAVTGASTAHAQIGQRYTFDDVIQKSDQIFVATCEGKSTRWKDGNVITTYKIRPKEFWKGAAATGKDGALQIDQIGGSVSAGPVKLGQHFSASVAMVPGEELLLFTKTHKTDPALKAAGQKDIFPEGQLQVVGMYQGRYSIVTDGKSGAKHVLPVGMEAYGVVANDESVKRYLNLKAGQLAAAREAAQALHDKQGRTDDLTVEQILEQLWKNLSPAEREMLERLGDTPAGAAANPANAAAAQPPASGGAAKTEAKPRAKQVRSFEPLDALRRRVMNRLAELEGEGEKP